jgi:hypothetical protein
MIDRDTMITEFEDSILWMEFVAWTSEKCVCLRHTNGHEECPWSFFESNFRYAGTYLFSSDDNNLGSSSCKFRTAKTYILSICVFDNGGNKDICGCECLIIKHSVSGRLVQSFKQCRFLHWVITRRVKSLSISMQSTHMYRMIAFWDLQL